MDPAVKVAWGREGPAGVKNICVRLERESGRVTEPSDIDASTLRDMLERGERITVVDVRKREAHAEESISGSVNFDAYDALYAGDERVMEGLELPEGARVVTVCNRGHSSAVAAEQLRRQGYEAYCLEGGLEAWKGL